jgi:hypothetical protein
VSSETRSMHGFVEKHSTRKGWVAVSILTRIATGPHATGGMARTCARNTKAARQHFGDAWCRLSRLPVQHDLQIVAYRAAHFWQAYPQQGRELIECVRNIRRTRRSSTCGREWSIGLREQSV